MSAGQSQDELEAAIALASIAKSLKSIATSLYWLCLAVAFMAGAVIAK